MIRRRVPQAVPAPRRGMSGWLLAVGSGLLVAVVGLAAGVFGRLLGWRVRGVPVGAAVGVFVIVQTLRLGGL